jgi:hypothetical protein
MEVSLDQAIDIYAKVLKNWYGEGASHKARTEALACEAVGDTEGFSAWVRVAKVCEALHTVDQLALICEAE